MDQQAILDRLDQIDAAVANAQLHRCQIDATRVQYQVSMVQIMDTDIGPIRDLARECRELLTAPEPEPVPDPTPEPEPSPEPGPPPAPQFVAPLRPGAVYGQTKWLPGSLGCDLFVPRGTPVYAPADCLIERVVGGTGLQGGAEMILATPDRQIAWRYRHTQAEVSVGQYVPQGARVGHVYDSSMDLLGPTPAWFPAPDGYQHLDLSVAYGTDQFSPQGGGGGNVSAYDWLQMIGYQGTVYTRTPGPPDAGH